MITVTRAVPGRISEWNDGPLRDVIPPVVTVKAKNKNNNIISRIRFMHVYETRRFPTFLKKYNNVICKYTLYIWLRFVRMNKHVSCSGARVRFAFRLVRRNRNVTVKFHGMLFRLFFILFSLLNLSNKIGRRCQSSVTKTTYRTIISLLLGCLWNCFFIPIPIQLDAGLGLMHVLPNQITLF
jgi:hypothetical protein